MTPNRAANKTLLAPGATWRFQSRPRRDRFALPGTDSRQQQGQCREAYGKKRQRPLIRSAAVHLLFHGAQAVNHQSWIETVDNPAHCALRCLRRLIRAVTAEGREFRGFRVNEDTFTIQIKDASNHYYSFRKADLGKLEKQFGQQRYGRIDTQFPLEKRGALMEFLKNNPPAKLLRSPLAEMKAYDGVKFIAQDTSWLMLRGSGTEPILRIYAEARDAAGVHKLLKEGVRLTTRVVSHGHVT